MSFIFCIFLSFCYLKVNKLYDGQYIILLFYITDKFYRYYFASLTNTYYIILFTDQLSFYYFVLRTFVVSVILYSKQIINSFLMFKYGITITLSLCCGQIILLLFCNTDELLLYYFVPRTNDYSICVSATGKFYCYYSNNFLILYYGQIVHL